ncbi:M10 family metallopeptidase [Tsuneonella sp. HG222]
MFRDLGDVDFAGLAPDVQGLTSGANVPSAFSNTNQYAPIPGAAADVPAGIAGAGSIAVGGSVTVSVEALGDRDWYAVQLTAGKVYSFLTHFDASNTDAHLSLRNATGAEIAANDDGGEANNAAFAFTAQTSGTYYIDAGTWDNLTTGSFYLTVAEWIPIEPDLVGGSIATASSLAVNGSVQGAINAGADHDFYAIQLVAGQTYLFRTGAAAIDAETDTTLALRSSSGAVVAQNDDVNEGVFSGIRYTPTASGTYYLDVGGVAGQFVLSAFKAPTPTVFSIDQIALQLTENYWQRYDHHFDVTAGGQLTYNVTALTPEGQSLARIALGIWSDVTGINFVEVGGSAQINYDDEEEGAFAGSELAGDVTVRSNVNVDKTWLTKYGADLDDYTFQAYLHETGHALGLGHAGNYNTTAEYAYDAIYLNDSWAVTVMSYFSPTENTYTAAQSFSSVYVGTPRVADGVAVANLYGAATTTRTGDTVYGFGSTAGRAVYDASQYPGLAYTVFDSGGNDTLNYSGFSVAQRIDLRQEAFSDIGGRVGTVSIARGTVIENAIGGGGADLIIGNSANNRLTGNGGNDALFGGTGADTLIGGAGIDTASYENDEGGVFVNLSLGRGYGNASFGDTYDSIENVIGTAYNDFVIGDPGVNRLDGAGGDDTIIGAVGADVIIGGSGFDWASYEDNSGVVFINLTLAKGYNNAAEGDTYEGVEHLVGGLMDDFFIGNDGANRLNGAMGADTLLGAGGADVFMFTYAPGATSIWGNPNVDLILDFATGVDRIELSAAAFPGLPVGTLAAGAFWAGTAAHDGDDRILYDAASGKLFFDPDGTGGQAALLFAVLGETSHPAAIAASDFVVV